MRTCRARCFWTCCWPRPKRWSLGLLPPARTRTESGRTVLAGHRMVVGGLAGRESRAVRENQEVRTATAAAAPAATDTTGRRPPDTIRRSCRPAGRSLGRSPADRSRIRRLDRSRSLGRMHSDPPCLFARSIRRFQARSDAR